jgi:hypothetical protein
VGSLPASIRTGSGRKWRYALAGEGRLAGIFHRRKSNVVHSDLGVPLGVNGQISVVQDSLTLRRITVISSPGTYGRAPIPVQLATHRVITMPRFADPWGLTMIEVW